MRAPPAPDSSGRRVSVPPPASLPAARQCRCALYSGYVLPCVRGGTNLDPISSLSRIIYDASIA